jgi:hypothetical protein
MLDLYFSELRRLRNGALIYGVATLLAMTLLGQLTDIPGGPREFHIGLVLLAMLSGVGLAVYQFGSYRQPSRWIWLLHRPLHRARILAAIGLASATLAVLALALPLFVVLLAQDHFSGHVIDQRHYAGAAFLALSALSAWLAGAYMVLHRSRWAFVILVLPILLTMHLASWGVLLALSVACNALLAGLVYTVFRPDRIASGDALTTAASALPLQASFYLALLWGGSTLYQMGLIAAGAYPMQNGHVTPGGHAQMQRATVQDSMLAGLGSARDQRVPAWRAALSPDALARVGPQQRQFAVPGLMTNLGTVHFRDGREGDWVFSQDRMIYKGVNLRTGVPLGWYGAGGRGDLSPFDTLPVVQSDNRKRGYLVTAHDLYVLADAGARLRWLLHVDGAEQLGGGVAQVGQDTLVLTNRRLLVLGNGATPSVQATLPLPRPFGDLTRVDTARVADGLLVSFTYGQRQMEGEPDARQLTWLVAPNGQAHEVAQRTLAHDFPLLFEHRGWWLSPALQALVNLPDMLIDEGVVPDDGASRFAPLLRPRPAGAWAAAIVLALLSGAGGAWWTRRARMPARARLAWCLACLLLGVPALLSLMVLRPRATQPRAQGAGAATPAAPAATPAAAPVPAPAPAGR